VLEGVGVGEEVDCWPQRPPAPYSRPTAAADAPAHYLICTNPQTLDGAGGEMKMQSDTTALATWLECPRALHRQACYTYVIVMQSRLLIRGGQNVNF